MAQRSALILVIPRQEKHLQYRILDGKQEEKEVQAVQSGDIFL